MKREKRNRDVERDAFDMIVWAYMLGESKKDLKNCEKILEDWLNANTVNIETDHKELWKIFHKIQSIVDIMDP